MLGSVGSCGDNSNRDIDIAVGCVVIEGDADGCDVGCFGVVPESVLLLLMLLL